MTTQYSVRVTESIHQARDVLPEDLYLAGMGPIGFTRGSPQAMSTEKIDASQQQNDLQQRRLKVEAAAAAIRAKISRPARRVAKCREVFLRKLPNGKFVISLATPVSRASDVVSTCSPMVTTSLVVSEAQTNTNAINLSTRGEIVQHLPKVNEKAIGAAPPITQKRKSSIALLNWEQIARSLKAGKKVKDCFVEYLAENEGQRVFGRAMFYALVRKSKDDMANSPTLLSSSAPSPSS